MLATQVILVIVLSIILFQERRYRLEKVGLGEHLTRVQVDLMETGARIRTQSKNLEALRESYHELFKLLKTDVAIDVGYKNVGWLIFVAKVQGRDMVKIQHLKPEMSLKEYQDLVERLSYSCQRVAYIDGPPYYEQFLKSETRWGPR